MDRRRNLLFILLSLCIGGLLTYWLYVRFHVLFFFIFIPIIGLGGSFLSRVFRLRRMEGHEEHRDTGDETSRLPSRERLEGRSDDREDL